MPFPLRSLPSDQLLAQLDALVVRDCALEVEVLTHLGEVDARRLCLREGYSSMFGYCVGVLHFAESVAYKRIAAARAARRHPELLGALGCRDLHLTAVSLLAPRLTCENAHELMAAARHKTSDEIRRMLADRKPKPDVAASVRRLAHASGAPAPDVRQPTSASTEASRLHIGANQTGESEPSGDQGEVQNPPPAVAEPRRRPVSLDPLGHERYAVRFTAGRELHAQLQELRALMRHQVPDGDLAEILTRAVGVLLKQVRKQKFAECSAPRAAKPAGDAPSRQIPAAIRRAVAKRDGERCSFVSPGGHRCGVREFLEFHHCDPWAFRGAHDAETIALRCRAHNRYAADRDFGKEHMSRFRNRETTSARPQELGDPDESPASA